MPPAVNIVVIVVCTALFSVVWFAGMAVVHAAFVGSNVVAFGAQLVVGSMLFGVVVSLLRDHVIPGLDRRATS